MKLELGVRIFIQGRKRSSFPHIDKGPGNWHPLLSSVGLAWNLLLVLGFVHSAGRESMILHTVFTQSFCAGNGWSYPLTLIRQNWGPFKGKFQVGTGHLWKRLSMFYLMSWDLPTCANASIGSSCGVKGGCIKVWTCKIFGDRTVCNWITWRAPQATNFYKGSCHFIWELHNEFRFKMTRCKAMWSCYPLRAKGKLLCYLKGPCPNHRTTFMHLLARLRFDLGHWCNWYLLACLSIVIYYSITRQDKYELHCSN